MKDLIKLFKLTHKFQRVKRGCFAPGEERYENNAEHSYQLAFLAWYIIDANKLDLDLEKVFKYALAHDLVEIYAGDTYLYSTQEWISNKQEREEAAKKQLKGELSEFNELHSFLNDYEIKNDQESKFVYALDKILPIFNAYLDDGRTWKTHAFTLEMINKHAKEKVALSPEIKKYYDLIIKALEENKATLFNK